MTSTAGLDTDAAYRALSSRDPRFDGRVWFGVTSTGIYCRPVCPARTPKRENVRVFASRAAAVAAGFRACRRCRPDTAPGTRDWDTRHDLAARAVRLIGSGVVDQVGVSGLADRLHVSARHLHRTLVAEVGTGVLPLAVSRRAQTARLLLDQTDLPVADVAFAAGFASIRQFNDVMRRELGVTPTQVRAMRRAGATVASDSASGGAAGTLVLRLRRRPPYDHAAVLATRLALAPAAVDLVAGTVDRTVRLPSGIATVHVSLAAADDHAVLTATGAALSDLAALVAAVRRWLDLDADPVAVTEALGADPLLAGLVAQRPGMRVPASLDPWEAVVAAVVAQRVSVPAALAVVDRLAQAFAEPRAEPPTEPPAEPFTESPAVPLTESPAVPPPLPDAAAVAAAGPQRLHALGLPLARARTVHALAEAMAAGSLPVAPGGDPTQARAALLAVLGVGPWTAEVVAMRALGDPDAFPATDLVLRRAAAAVGLDPRDLPARATDWRPWRSYAAAYLWRGPASPRPGATAPNPHPTKEPTA